MGYTNSSLVDYVRISPNKTVNRNHVIDTVTIHCVVGQVTVERLGEIFAPTSRQASSNYGVGLDGKIGMYVEEKDRSWCSSSRENDHRAITIEVASDTASPYAVNDKVYAALINLLVDICKRNNINALKWSTNKSDRINHVNGCNMTVHRDFAATSCPGDYLYSRQGQIADEVNRRLGVASSQSSTSSIPSTSTANTYTVIKGDTLSGIGAKLKIAWKDIADLNGIKSPYVINVGQVLKLPTSENTPGNAPAASPSAPTTPSNTSSTYTVVKGDTLSGIGSKLKINWKSIADLNGIKSPYVINVGQVLKLPASNTSSNSSSSTAPSTSVTKILAGTKLNLKSVKLYASSSAKSNSSTKSGTYYAWSDDVVNNRIRITNSTANVGKSNQVTAWINYEDAKKSL